MHIAIIFVTCILFGVRSSSGQSRPEEFEVPEPPVRIPVDCYDIGAYCESYVGYGYCDSQNRFYAYMQENCRSACNFCRPEEPTPPEPPGHNCAGVRCHAVYCSEDEVLSQGAGECCPKCVKRPKKGCMPVYKQTNLVGIGYQGKICETIAPVVSSACFGVCASASVQLLSGKEVKTCQCCQGSRTERATTVLKCKDPRTYYTTQVLYDYSVILACACQSIDDEYYREGEGAQAMLIPGESSDSMSDSDVTELDGFAGMFSSVRSFNGAD